MTERVATGRSAVWVVRGPDGVPLTGRVDRAPGERAAVLLTHGLGEHLGRYAALTEAFLAAGVTVLRYDQRGHGGSPGRRAVVDAGLLVADHLAARRAAARVAPGPAPRPPRDGGPAHRPGGVTTLRPGGRHGVQPPPAGGARRGRRRPPRVLPRRRRRRAHRPHRAVGHRPVRLILTCANAVEPTGGRPPRR